MKLPRKKRDETSATITQTLLLILACSALCAFTALGADPGWWSSGTPPAVDSTRTPNKFAAVNQGQLKQFTVKAVAELNVHLPGGAGTELNSIVTGWANEYANNGYGANNIKPADYTAMNEGQLRYFGNKVWARLVAEGYVNTKPSWLAKDPNSDYKLANIAQLKMLYNFELTTDSDANGLPDWWEIHYFGHTMGSLATTSVNGNGLTLLQDFAQNNDPTNYYSQYGQIVVPTVTVISGNNQSCPAGTVTSAPLVVQVTNSSGGAVLANAPVIFAADAQGGSVSASASGPFAATAQAIADSNGYAQVWYLQPGINGLTSQITATAGTGVPVAFTAVSTLNSNAPAAPTNLTITVNGLGDITLSWTNNATGVSGFIIQQSLDGVTFTTIGTAGPTATSFNVSGNAYVQGATYQVIAVNQQGTQSTPLQSGASTPATPPAPDPPRYAVIDLGVNQTPIKITNSGYILMSAPNPPGSPGLSYSRWYNGTPQALSAPGPSQGAGYTSDGNNDPGELWVTPPGKQVYPPDVPTYATNTDFVPVTATFPVVVYGAYAEKTGPATTGSPGGDSFPQSYSISDISETGSVVGAADYEVETYRWGAWDIYDSFPSGTFGEGPAVYNWECNVTWPAQGFVTLATWAAGSSTPSEELVTPTLYWNKQGIGPKVLAFGTSALHTYSTRDPDTSDETPEDAENAPPGALDLYLDATDQVVSDGSTVTDLTSIICNNTGDLLDFSAKTLNSTTLDFTPSSLSNDSGSVFSNPIVVGSSGGHIVFWTQQSVDKSLEVGGAVAVNAATKTVSTDPSGNPITPVQRPAAQIVVGNGTHCGILEEDPVKTTDPTNPQFKPSQDFVNLIAPQSGWSNFSPSGAHCINDSGAVVGIAQLTKNPDGTPAPKDPNTGDFYWHGLSLPPVEVIEDTNANYQGDATDNRLTSVGFGLWDNAFSTANPTTVLDGATETTNFVGSDSKRFYLRVYDPSANHSSTTADTVTMDWYTQKQDGTDDDHPGSSGQEGVDLVTLTETGPNTGLFVSKALMLVTDDVDNQQHTDPGSGNMGGDYHDIDHRLRRAALDDKMCFSYTPATTGSMASTMSVPVVGSGASPCSDKTMTVQVANLYQGKSFTMAQSDAYIQAIEASVRARYAVEGIKINFQYAYGSQNDWVSIPSTTGIDLNAMADGSGGATGDEGRLATIVKAKYAGADSHTIFLILIQQFAIDGTPDNYTQNQGEAYTDGEIAQVPGYAPSLHCSFVARLGLGSVSSTTCVPPHELGHQLSDQTTDDTVNNNHYQGTALQADQNLMRASAGDPTPGSTIGAKRLWNDPNHPFLSHPKQIDFMRQSPLLQ